MCRALQSGAWSVSCCCSLVARDATSRYALPPSLPPLKCVNSISGIYGELCHSPVPLSLPPSFFVGVSTQLLNQRLGEKRKVRKTLYTQNCVKGFLRERNLLPKAVRGGEVEMVEKKEAGSEEEEGGGGLP